MTASQPRRLRRSQAQERQRLQHPPRKLLLLAVPLVLLELSCLPAKAESRTAESIWSQADAQQRAIEQIPLNDRDGITQTRCQEIGVGRMGSLPRFRCTVWFEPKAP